MSRTTLTAQNHNPCGTPGAPVDSGDFATAVNDGLSATEKFLPSKYFYDDRGSRIFQEIMQLEEYYLTRSEDEIFNTRKSEFSAAFFTGTGKVHLVELGAGDGKKTRILLSHLHGQKLPFSYTAIDISSEALMALARTLHDELPDADLQLLQADYFEGLSQMTLSPGGRKVIMFLGSNIGNLDQEQTSKFLTGIRAYLQTDDLMVIGFDLKKDPEIILNAYNDKHGVTGAFNLNLLRRINEELESNFDLSKFEHCPLYDEIRGEARSYIRSTCTQEVCIEKLGKRFQFQTGELIHTEISRKYDTLQIEKMAEANGFAVVQHLFDSRKNFCDSIWECV